MGQVSLVLVAGPGLGAEAVGLVTAMARSGFVVDRSSTGDAADPVAEVQRGAAHLALVSVEAPGPTPIGIQWAAVPARPEPRDVLIPSGGVSATLRNLAAGTRVGVAGARRWSFLRAHRADVEAVALANGGGPGAALASGAVDAAILGASEMRRSELDWRATEILDPREWVPGPRQGAVALLAREEDAAACSAASSVEDPGARAAVKAETSVVEALGVPPTAPLGTLALPQGRRIRLWGMVASLDGRGLVRGDLTWSMDEPEAAGRALADLLLARGAREILTGSPL